MDYMEFADNLAAEIDPPTQPPALTTWATS
jgi:hypothetical protein